MQHCAGVLCLSGTLRCHPFISRCSGYCSYGYDVASAYQLDILGVNGKDFNFLGNVEHNTGKLKNATTKMSLCVCSH